MSEKAFLLYSGSRELVEKLNMEQRGELLTAIFRHVDGESIGNLDITTDIVFTAIRQYLDRNLEAYEKKCVVNRANGAKGGRPRKPKETQENRTVFSETLNDNDNKNDNDNDNDNDNLIKGDTKRVNTHTQNRFQAPTVEEVRIYVESKGYKVDAQRFVDYYEARGWELAKGRKVKDWKACVRTWAGNETEWNTEKNKRNGVRISDEQRKEYPKFGDLFAV